MLISISVTYADINATHPRMIRQIPKRILTPRRKRPIPSTVLDQLIRRLKKVRSKIKSRLDATTFRLGDPSKLNQKRVEAMKMKNEYNMLVRRIAGLRKQNKLSKPKKKAE